MCDILSGKGCCIFFCNTLAKSGARCRGHPCIRCVLRKVIYALYKIFEGIDGFVAGDAKQNGQQLYTTFMLKSALPKREFGSRNAVQ